MKKKIGIMGLILGLFMFVYGFAMHIPEEKIDTSTGNLPEDVDGDASVYIRDTYSDIIKAELKGGVISGAMVSKSVYICSGISIAFLSLVLIARESDNKKIEKEN